MTAANIEFSDIETSRGESTMSQVISAKGTFTGRRICLGIPAEQVSSMCDCVEYAGHIVVSVATSCEEFRRNVASDFPDIGILSSDFADAPTLVDFAMEIRRTWGLSLILLSRTQNRATHLTRLFRAHWSGVITEPVDSEQLREVLDIVIGAGREQLNVMSGFFFFCLVESLQDMVLVVNENDRVVYLNHSARRKLLFDSASSAEKTVQELFGLKPGPEKERIRSMIDTVRAQGRGMIFEIETGITTTMNVPLMVSGVLSKLTLPQEKAPVLVLLLHDSTRRKRSRVQLRKLSNVVRNMKDKVVITDVNGRIEYVNSAFESCTGYSWQEAVGRTPRMLRSGRHHADFYRIMREALLSGEPFRAVFTNRKKDGTFYQEDQVISPVYGDTGALEYFVALGRNVTDQMHAEERLRESLEQSMDVNRKMRDTVKIRADFVATISHEIRTPLTVIMGCVQNLQDEILGPLNPGQSNVLGMMSRSSEQLARLIGNVLDYEKMSEGTLEFKPTRMDFVAHVREVSHRLEYLATTRGLVLSRSLPDKPLFVNGDAVRLEQVISNLVHNAVKYAKSHVFITVAGTPECVIMEVMDDGPGIPEDQLESIFFRFVQARDHVHEGVGLGLEIVRSIVKAHGGSVVADNYRNRSTAGARFTVKLPHATRQTGDDNG